MVQYGPYEYSDNEALKLTEYLKNCARQRADSMENKGGGTADLTLALSCRNVGSPVALVIHLTKAGGAPTGKLFITMTPILQ